MQHTKTSALVLALSDSCVAGLNSSHPPEALMHHTTLALLCTLATPGLVAMAQPCTAPPFASGSVGWVEPIACYPQLSWSPARGAVQYMVFRSLSGTMNDAEFVGTTSSPSFVDWNFPANLYSQNVYYHVRGVNDCGQGPVVRSGPRQVTSALTISRGVAGAGCNRVSIYWLPPFLSGGGFIRYSVWRTPVEGGEPVRIAQDLSLTEYVDLNPPPGWFRYSVSTSSSLCEGPQVECGEVAGHPLTAPRIDTSSHSGCGTAYIGLTPVACATSYSILRAPMTDPDAIVEVARTTDINYFDHVPDRTMIYYYAAVAHTPFGDAPQTPWRMAWVFDHAPWFYPIDPSTTFSVCAHGGSTLTAPLYYSHDLMSIQWYKDGQPLADGGNISGAHELDLHINPASELDAGSYAVSVTTDCGSADSEPLNVRYADCGHCAPCAADFNQDGGVDGGDIQSFMQCWQDSEFCGDVNQDGGSDGQDIEAFFSVWGAGCC